jgi:hypothetical protein
MLLPNTALDSLLNITVLQQQQQDMLTKGGNGSQGNPSSNEMKMELLMETSLLPFIETLLLNAEKEEDMICKELIITLVKIFQEQLMS